MKADKSHNKIYRYILLVGFIILFFVIGSEAVKALSSCSGAKNSSWCGDLVCDPGLYCEGDNIMCDDYFGCFCDKECVSNCCLSGGTASSGKMCKPQCSAKRDTSWCGDGVCDPGIQCCGNNTMCSAGKSCDCPAECINNSCLDGVCRKCYSYDSDNDGYAETCKDALGIHQDGCVDNKKRVWNCGSEGIFYKETTGCTGYTCNVRRYGEPVGLKNNGQTCSIASECYSDKCVNNYCCDRDCSASEACNISGHLGTCYPIPASGAVILSLNPLSAVRGSEIQPSATGLFNCQGKQVIFTDNAGAEKSRCTVVGNGTGCIGPTFTAPPTPGNYPYHAYVDINGDGNYAEGAIPDSGEHNSVVLEVVPGFCFPNLSGCENNCSGMTPGTNGCRNNLFITGYCNYCSLAGSPCSWCLAAFSAQTACYCLEKANSNNYSYCGRIGADNGFRVPVTDTYTVGSGANQHQFDLSLKIAEYETDGCCRYWYHKTSGNSQQDFVDDKINTTQICSNPANLQINTEWTLSASPDKITIKTKLEDYHADHTFNAGFTFKPDKPYRVKPPGDTNYGACCFGAQGRELYNIIGINNSTAGTIKANGWYATEINLEYCGDGEVTREGLDSAGGHNEVCDTALDPTYCKSDCTCKLKNGSCTVSSDCCSDLSCYDNICKDPLPPTARITIKRKSTSLPPTESWFRADTYTIQFTDSDNVGGSDLKSCGYYINSCNIDGTNCTTIVEPEKARICNGSKDINSIKV